MKKIIVVTLLLLTIFGSINPINIYAATTDDTGHNKIEKLSLPKDNLTIIEGNIGNPNLVYTYDIDGDSYKVVENANEDLSEVYSTIYIKNSEGNYEEFSTQELKLYGHTAELTTNTGSESVTSYQNIAPESSLNNGIFPQAGTEAEFGINGINGTCYGYATGGWRNLGINDLGSTGIASYTVTGIVGAMTYIITNKATAGMDHQGVAAGVVAAIAGRAAEAAVPTLYYSMNTYDLRIANPPVGLTNFTVGINIFARWYTHSSRGSNFLLGTTDDYMYHSCHSF